MKLTEQRNWLSETKKDLQSKELTAEMGASYLKSYAGIPIEQLENNAAYIQNWLERLKKYKKFIVYASSQAQKITNFILNISDEKELVLYEKPEKSNKSDEKERELKEMRKNIKKESIEKIR